jgi:adenine-specific DNA glycosylase
MWRLPTLEIGAGESNPAAAERACRDLIGSGAKPVGLRAEIVHHVTRFRVELQVWQVETGNAAAPTGANWVDRQTLLSLALPAPYRKLVRRLGLQSG